MPCVTVGVEVGTERDVEGVSGEVWGGSGGLEERGTRLFAGP